MKQGYYIEEHDIGEYQSVFPQKEAHLSQLHANIEDAIFYMNTECGVKRHKIKLILSKEV